MRIQTGWLEGAIPRQKLRTRLGSELRKTFGTSAQWLRPWRSERAEPESLLPLLWAEDEDEPPLLAGAECGADGGAEGVEATGAERWTGAE